LTKQRIALTSILVHNYDESIDFYTNILGFELIEDTLLEAATSTDTEKRWVVVRPTGATESGLLLAQASNEQQSQSVGVQCGGRVFLFLHTDDFWRDYKSMQEQNIQFVREPVEETWGTVAVFADLYGNLWDFIQPSAENSALKNS